LAAVFVARHSGLRSGLASAKARLTPDASRSMLNRRTELLPPRVIKRSGVDRVEPEFVHQLHHDLFGTSVIARYWQSNTPRRSLRAATFQQTFVVLGTECFDNGSAKLGRDPPAFDHTVLDARNPAIA
jgi:hypothetical protein